MDKVIISTPIELSNLIEESLKKVLLCSNLTDQKDSLPDYLNLIQASEFLNLKPQTIYGFTSNRSIPFIKKGKKLLFKKSVLEKWLLEGSKGTKEEIQFPTLKKKKGGKNG